MESKQTGFYHHGTVPGEDMLRAIKKTGGIYAGRNADFFNASGVEDFGQVVVDDGVNTDTIRSAYEDKGVPVVTADEYAADVKPKAPKPETPFDPDADRKQGRAPKAQGKPKAPKEEAAPQEAAQ